MTTDRGPAALSVVATVYNDAGLVRPLVNAIRNAVEPVTASFEIVLVDDHSPDGSAQAIRDAARDDPRVKGVLLSRNCGQQTAMSAGIHHASGEHVIIMDGDLQNPPEEIPNILTLLRAGNDVVYCVGTTRNSFMSEVVSMLFWFVLRRVFGVRIVANQIMMKGLSRRVVDHYAQYPETNRVVAGIVADIGLRFVVHPVVNRRRPSGRSQHGLFGRVRLAIDILLEMTPAPLDWMVYIGLLGTVLALGYSGVMLFRYLRYAVPPGFTSIVLAITFFGSLIIFMLGLIGRYVANIYREVRRRPLYLVDERINFEPSEK